MKTSEYYKSNPEARKKRLKQQAKLNKTAKEKARRSELGKLNRKKGAVGDGKDISHKKDGTTTLESASTNRARNGMKKGQAKTTRTNTKK
jgi:hypothetical protein